MNPNELMERYNTIINKVPEEQIAFLQNLNYVNSLLQKEQKQKKIGKQFLKELLYLKNKHLIIKKVYLHIINKELFKIVLFYINIIKLLRNMV